MPKWVVAVGAVALVALLVAAGIWATRAESEPTAAASSSAATPDPSRSIAPTPTPTPTPEIVLWAGEVCAARDASAGALLAALSGRGYSQSPAVR